LLGSQHFAADILDDRAEITELTLVVEDTRLLGTDRSEPHYLHHFPLHVSAPVIHRGLKFVSTAAHVPKIPSASYCFAQQQSLLPCLIGKASILSVWPISS